MGPINNPARFHYGFVGSPYKQGGFPTLPTAILIGLRYDCAIFDSWDRPVYQARADLRGPDLWRLQLLGVDLYLFRYWGERRCSLLMQAKGAVFCSTPIAFFDSSDPENQPQNPALKSLQPCAKDNEGKELWLPGPPVISARESTVCLGSAKVGSCFEWS